MCSNEWIQEVYEEQVTENLPSGAVVTELSTDDEDTLVENTQAFYSIIGMLQTIAVVFPRINVSKFDLCVVLRRLHPLWKCVIVSSRHWEWYCDNYQFTGRCLTLVESSLFNEYSFDCFLVCCVIGS